MIRLPELLHASARSGINSPSFHREFKQMMSSLDPKHLPLQQGLQHSSVALDDALDFVLLATSENESSLRLKAGIFYQGIIAGCSCADDPTPVDTVAESCEVEIGIDKGTGEAVILLVD